MCLPQERDFDFKRQNDIEDIHQRVKRKKRSKYSLTFQEEIANKQPEQKNIDELISEEGFNPNCLKNVNMLQ